MRAAEFSRLVALARLDRGPVREAIEATPAEREALARRFGLVALDHLSAEIELHREKNGGVVLRAKYETCFHQSCVVCLEPVAGRLSDRFALHYGEGSEDQSSLSVDPEDEEVFEPLGGPAIDIGEAVAQEVSLVLPAFPRHPDASVEESLDPPGEKSGAAADSSPFAVLKELILAKKS